MSFLGNLSTQDFLQNYWEKKPLLIRGAVKNIESYATAQDLKDLALDEDFESRIVYNDEKIAVKHGPLVEEDFNQKSWTLVCHNLNLLDDDFYSLQKELNFLPDWLFDDIMATHSKADATIGAHIDKYNVFILQGNGKRKWQLQTNPDPTYVEGIDIKILKNFHPNIEWILEPGDMIYIPSNVAHRGISLTESISYSLGFKSLEDEIVFKNYLNDFIQNFESDDYLKDATKQPVSDPFCVRDDIIEHFWQKLNKLTQDKEQFKMWMTSFLSTPRGEIESGTVYVEEEILELIQDHVIKKDIYTKLAATKREDDYALAINNQLYAIAPENYPLIQKWFNGSPLDEITIECEKLDNQLWPLVIDLFKNGTFYFEQRD